MSEKQRQAKLGKFKPYTLPELSATTWAYLAGIVDGEGTIRMSAPSQSTNGYIYPMFYITNTDLKLVKQIQKWLKIKDTSVYSMPPSKSEDGYDRKPCYRFTITGTLRSYKILQKLLPYLIIKKEKAKNVIAFVERKLL